MAKIATGGNARVFLIEGRARGDHAPQYEYNLRLTGPSQGYGEIERIEEPDPNQYNSWIEAGETRGATERASATLEGRYARDVLSDMLRLARKKCAFDIQLHFGACQDPRNFTSFEKILILENASGSSWSTGDLGALSADDNAAVDESLEVSATDMYEVVPMGFGAKAGSIVTNEVKDVTIGDSVSCGECTTESDGCKKIYAVTLGAGGSPSTPADVIYSIDKGITWYAADIDTATSANPASAVAVVGNYLVVSVPADNGIFYALTSQFDGSTDPAFTKVTTGTVTGRAPNAFASYGNGLFAVGNYGHIYYTEDPTAGLTLLDGGTLTIGNLNDVSALSADFAVAVGNGGAVVYTTNGTSWSLAAKNPVGVGVNLNCVFAKSETEWWVGTSTGKLYYTLNGGTTWTEKTFPGSGAGVVYHIKFSTDSVGYISHSTATPAGRILRTYDGGNSWIVMPETSGTIPANDRINAIAVCDFDPNFVVGVGLADDASDGFVVVGSA